MRLLEPNFYSFNRGLLHGAWLDLLTRSHLHVRPWDIHLTGITSSTTTSKIHTLEELNILSRASSSFVSLATDWPLIGPIFIFPNLHLKSIWCWSLTDILGGGSVTPTYITCVTIRSFHTKQDSQATHRSLSLSLSVHSPEGSRSSLEFFTRKKKKKNSSQARCRASKLKPQEAVREGGETWDVIGFGS